MTENWERLFELTLEPSTYVLYLGDDDGLLPGALECAERVIRKYQCTVLNWEKAEYAWPDIVASAYRNYAAVRLSSSVEQVYSAPFLTSVHAMETSYSAGPSIYSSFVQLPILREIRQAAQGRFFRSCSPDVFSSYAIAASIDSFTRCNFALSVNGASGNSNGIAYIHQFQSDASAQFRASRPIHSSLVHAPSVCIAEADGLLTARDALPERFGRHYFNFDKLFVRLEEEASNASSERRLLLRAAIKDICDKNGLAQPRMPEHFGNSCAVIEQGPVFGYAPSSSHLTVDFGLIGIENVAEACRAIAMLNPLERLPFDGDRTGLAMTQSAGKSIFRRIIRKVASYL